MSNPSAALFACCALLMTSGCANITPRMKDLAPAPPARVSAFQVAGADTAEVHFLRPSTVSGIAINYRISIDGAPAAAIGDGERVTVWLQPGERLIEVRHPSEILGAPGEATALQAQPSTRYYFVINSDLGVIKLRRTTAGAVGE